MMKLIHKMREEKGFTLIELMVVVLIIAILIAIAIPVFNVARERTRARACQASMRTVLGALETYAASYEQYPANIVALVPAFVKSQPVCPSGGTYTYTPGNLNADPPISPVYDCSIHDMP